MGCLPKPLLKWGDCVEAKEEALQMDALHLNLQRLKCTISTCHVHLEQTITLNNGIKLTFYSERVRFQSNFEKYDPSAIYFTHIKIHAMFQLNQIQPKYTALNSSAYILS